MQQGYAGNAYRDAGTQILKVFRIVKCFDTGTFLCPFQDLVQWEVDGSKQNMGLLTATLRYSFGDQGLQVPEAWSLRGPADES
jgi:hypothetical protein